MTAVRARNLLLAATAELHRCQREFMDCPCPHHREQVIRAYDVAENRRALAAEFIDFVDAVVA